MQLFENLNFNLNEEVALYTRYKLCLSKIVGQG